MGAGASVDERPGGPRRPTVPRYFCHSCRRTFSHRGGDSSSVTCPMCSDTFVEMIEEFSSSGGEGGARALRAHGGHQDIHSMLLSEQQRRQLINAAALLQLLEAHLREELRMLEFAVRDSENSNKGPRALTEMEKHSFVKTTALDTDALCAQPSCPICGEDFHLNESALQLQCSHFFHDACVVPWLETKHNCPICRFEITDELPSLSELEELTVLEIRQRVAWHGHAPSSFDKPELAKQLHDIVTKHRESYEDNRKESVENLETDSAPSVLPVRRRTDEFYWPGGVQDVEGRDASARAGAAAVGLRLGRTYTISSSGVLSDSFDPSHRTIQWSEIGRGIGDADDGRVVGPIDGELERAINGELI